MSLFHSKPVTVQRTYYKPSVMARLKAMFTPNRPRTTVTAPRRNRRTAAPAPRRRVYGAGLFHRTPRRRAAVTPTRGHVSTKARIMAALRPRRHTRATRTAPVRTRYGHGHRQHHHNGSKVAALLGLLALKKRHDHNHNHSHHRRY